jgi:hypothetical protein
MLLLWLAQQHCGLYAIAKYGLHDDDDGEQLVACAAEVHVWCGGGGTVSRKTEPMDRMITHVKTQGEQLVVLKRCMIGAVSWRKGSGCQQED